MARLTRLTDWETGDPIYLRLLAIQSMYRLYARTDPSEGDEPAHEIGERTRINTKADVFLVRETPEEVLEAGGVEVW